MYDFISTSYSTGDVKNYPRFFHTVDVLIHPTGSPFRGHVNESILGVGCTISFPSLTLPGIKKNTPGFSIQWMYCSPHGFSPFQGRDDQSILGVLYLKHKDRSMHAKTSTTPPYTGKRGHERTSSALKCW